MSVLLDIRGLEVSYGELRAVERLDLTIRRGETVALVGESGCGKSTSALAAMGLLPRVARVRGEALFEGRDLLTLAESELRALRGGAISMVFQDSATALNPVLSVGRQIVETLELHTPLRGAAARSRAIELLELVEIPRAGERIDHFPHQFSGGQRQRVAIAMAVACSPRLLIADEPTTALDVAIQGKILELLDRLKTEIGMGLLLITHDLALVSQWADRVAIMQHGRKLEEGPTERILNASTHPYTSVLLAAAIGIDSDRHYRTSRLAPAAPLSADPAVLRFPMPRSEIRPKPDREAVAPLLQLSGVHAHYRQGRQLVSALQGVDLAIAPGETLGLVGESGCGKSTLSRAIMRLQPVSSGSILFDGTDITALPERDLKQVRRRVQLVFQDPHAALNPRRRVIDIMHQALVVNGVANATERARRILEITDRVGLSSRSLERFPHEFSGGQKQRICIARALLPRPDLLICDEPASSLDLPIRAQVLDLLVDLKAEYGLSYLFISHDLSLVRYMADRVAVMQDGRIVETGGHQHIWQAAQHPYTRSLIEAAPRASASRTPSGLPSLLTPLSAPPAALLVATGSSALFSPS